MDEDKIIWLVVLCVVIIFLIFVYPAIKNKKSNSTTQRDDDRKIKSSQKTNNFYNELAFTFPTLANIDEPFEVSKYLFDHKNVTEELMRDEFSNVDNFKNENGQISFDMDGSHFKCNSASKEIVIDNTVHINANSEGILFSTDDKSISVSIHEEDGECVIDNYNTSNPEGISSEDENCTIENSVNEKLEVQESSVDEEIVESDTSD